MRASLAKSFQLLLNTMLERDAAKAATVGDVLLAAGAATDRGHGRPN